MSWHTVSVSTKAGFDASAAKTFKVFLKVGGAEYPLTVKTVASKAKPVLKLKASGAIDTAIPDSQIQLTVTASNFSSAKYKLSFIKQDTKAKTEEPADELFRTVQKGNVFTVTEAPGAGLTAGTYLATVTADVAGEQLSASAKLTVKATPASKAAITVTLKAKGSIDVIRPGTSIVLTPTVKNAADYVPDPADLIFYSGSGKNAARIKDPNKIPFDVATDGTAFILTRRAAFDHTKQKYAVGLSINMDGRTGTTKSPVALNVKMGSAKLVQNVKTLELPTTDRYAYGSLMISSDDATLAPIRKVVLDAASAKLIDVTTVTPGQYAVHYKGDEITASKDVKAKLSVFLDGNISSKANATINVTVKLVKSGTEGNVERTGWLLHFEPMEHGTAYCTDGSGAVISTADEGQTVFVVPVPEENYVVDAVEYKFVDDEAWKPLYEPYRFKALSQDTLIRIAFREKDSDEPIAVNSETFPDAVFCSIVSAFDKNGDELLSVAERNAVFEISCPFMGISSFAGIGNFPNLTVFDCEGNRMEELNLSRNTMLETLSCADCSNLKRVMLPQTLYEIQPRAFENCTALTEAVIPESVSQIGEYAFNGCTALHKVSMGRGVSQIGKGVFRECPALSDIVVS
ncbi:MAG: leucine-rich repeat protein [Oscillospiraceae bacterium]|nr:leucine-rich repeat protein [Oscillospiraceae bacterium]